MSVLNINEFRTARLRRKDILDVATIRELTHVVLNDLGTIAEAVNNIVSPIEASVSLTTGESIIFDYTNLAGDDFVVGENITNNTSGATGVVVSVSGGLTINTITGMFSSGDQIEGESANTADISNDPATADGAVTVTYDNLAVSTFQYGETVSNLTNGAEGVVVVASGTQLVLKNVTGRFDDNDGLEGQTSGSTADVDGATTYPSLDLSNSSGAHLFNLSSDNSFEVIESITNAPELPFRIIATGNTTFTVINGTVKTSGGANAVIDGDSRDWISFETRNSVIRETGIMQYQP